MTLKWAVRFVLRFSRTGKRYAAVIGLTGVSLLVGRWFDLYRMIVPATLPRSPQPGLLESPLAPGVIMAAIWWLCTTDGHALGTTAGDRNPPDHRSPPSSPRRRAAACDFYVPRAFAILARILCAILRMHPTAGDGPATPTRAPDARWCRTMTSETAKPESRNLRRGPQQPTEPLRFINRNRSEVESRPATTAERRKLDLIGRARRLGFDLHEALGLIRLSEGGGAPEGLHQTEIAEEFARQLAAVDERIVALMRLRGALVRLHERSPRLVGDIATLLVELEGPADG